MTGTGYRSHVLQGVVVHEAVGRTDPQHQGREATLSWMPGRRALIADKDDG